MANIGKFGCQYGSRLVRFLIKLMLPRSNNHQKPLKWRIYWSISGLCIWVASWVATEIFFRLKLRLQLQKCLRAIIFAFWFMPMVICNWDSITLLYWERTSFSNRLSPKKTLIKMIACIKRWWTRGCFLERKALPRNIIHMNAARWVLRWKEGNEPPHKK
jgi:hypothetical protein